jgi:hypothetical protein
MRDPISSHPPPGHPGLPDGADAQAAAAISRVRRLMLVALTLTFGAVAAVLALVGYRVFSSGGSPPPDVGVSLPAGARIVQTAVADDHLIVTLELGGTTEIRTYDLRTLKPVGRLTFAPPP